MTSLNTTCLKSVSSARTVISLQMCSNGIVEEGEDCDPGVGHSSPCCDTDTCKFAPKAECDPASSDCCSSDCEFAPASQMCKPARDPECDTQTKCSGSSSICPKTPAKHTKSDGTACGPGGLTCASGSCTSKDCKHTAGRIPILFNSHAALQYNAFLSGCR
jgi:hypothetical protein